MKLIQFLLGSIFSGINDWVDNDDILARVLAQSQVEYIDSLKKKNSRTANPHSSSSTTTTTTSFENDVPTTSTSNSTEYITSLPSTSSNY